MKHIFIIFLVLSPLLFSQDSIIVKQSKTPYNIGQDTSYFVDKNDEFSLLDIQKKNFTPYTKEILNFGFLAPTYWFKFHFKFDEAVHNSRWWLDINYPLLNYVDLYAFDTNNNLLFHKKNGSLVAKSEKDIIVNRILFSLPNTCDTTYTIYFKVKTAGSMLVPLKIISEKSLMRSIHFNQNLSGLYYGILVILILYSTITFLYSKENIYLLYVLFVISYAFWQLSFDGLGPYYFWSDNFWIIQKGPAFFMYSTTVALIVFSQKLLQANIRITKYNNVLLQPLKYIAILGVFASVLLPYKYTIVVGALLGVFTPIILFIAGVYVLKQGHYSMRFFVLGWGIFLTATVLFALSKFNLVHGFTIMKYGQQIGSVVDLVFLSVTLAYRFRQLQNEYTQKLQDYTKTLEEQVKTSLIKAREKDNLLMEQSKLASMGEMIEQIAHQWRQPLNNIGLINQDMYFKNRLNTLSDKDFEKFHKQIDTNIGYLSDTINNFRTYYQKKQDKETYSLDDAIETVIHITEATFKYYQINIILHTDKITSVYNKKSDMFQVLLNILNNAKDALIESETKNKTITISIGSDIQNAYIEILDNAGGVPYEIIDNIFDSYFSTKSHEKGTGIGLYMAKTIVETKMQGKISVQNQEDGACFYIQLPLG